MATAQVVTLTEDKSHPFIKKIKWDWACTDLGVVVSETTNQYSGELIRLITVPDAGGTQPTNLYDITITDEDGYDVLIGAGADRSNATTQQVIATSLGACLKSKLELNIANAGDAKGGICLLYIKTHRL